MADNIVRDGALGNLSGMLSRQLGRRVVVHRVETTYRKPGQTKLSKNIRYSLGIEGSHPPVFFNMTVEECKSRMAFLSDLISSGVVNASPRTDPHQTAPGADRLDPVPPLLPRTGADGLGVEEKGHGHGAGGHDFPPGSGDCDERPY